MGWTFTHRDRGEKIIDLLAMDLAPHEIVDSCIRLNAAYLAVRENGTEDITAVVVLLRHVRGHHYNFGTKYIQECAGPCECDCPERILDLLTPVEDMYEGQHREWAQQWRDACRANLARKASRPKLKVGMVVQFAEPIEFSNGRVLDKLTVESLKPLRFSNNGWGRYRIRRNSLDGATVVG